MLRRAYLQKQALIQFQQQDLQMQMTEAHSVNSSRLNTLTVGQAAQQIQENDVLLQEAFMQYSGLVCDGVSVIGLLLLLPLLFLMNLLLILARVLLLRMLGIIGFRL